MKERIRLFSNGIQYADWSDRNCNQCNKYNENPEETCPLEWTIAEADLGGGTISKEVADRIGFTGKEYTWDCPEKEAVNCDQ